MNSEELFKKHELAKIKAWVLNVQMALESVERAYEGELVATMCRSVLDAMPEVLNWKKNETK